MQGNNNTLPNHYIQMEQNYDKNVYLTSFLCVEMVAYLIFLQLLCCEKNLPEKCQVWQLTLLSCLVVKQNFANTNVIVNNHILLIGN